MLVRAVCVCVFDQESKIAAASNNKIKFQFRIDNIMSKGKKQSLTGGGGGGGNGETMEILCYKPKDLVW